MGVKPVTNLNNSLKKKSCINIVILL